MGNLLDNCGANEEKVASDTIKSPQKASWETNSQEVYTLNQQFAEGTIDNMECEQITKRKIEIKYNFFNSLDIIPVSKKNNNIQLLFFLESPYCESLRVNGYWFFLVWMQFTIF